MSSTGSSLNTILALRAPDLYAKQLSIQQRQALAQSLLQQGEGSTGSSAYGGLKNAGNSILGALLAKRANQDMADLYTPQPDNSSPQQVPSEPQISNNPGSGPVGAPQGVSPSGGPMDGQITNAPTQGAPSSSAPPQAQVLGQALQGKRTIPSVLAGAIRQLPGMSQQDSMQEYLQNPQAYYTALNAANAPTNEQRDINNTYGSGTDAARAAMNGLLQHNRTLNMRPGSFGYDPAAGTGIGVPDQLGMTPTMGNNGQVSLINPAQNQAAVAQGNMAANSGKQSVTPFTGYDAQGMPQATNNLAMTGNPAAQNLIPGQGQPQMGLGGRSNNPLNMQPGGQEARYANPMAGYVAASDNLANYGRQGVNTVSAIVKHWAGGTAPPEYTASVARQLGVDPNQPLNLQDPNVRGALIGAMQPNETGHDFASQGGGLMPALPASQGPYMASQGKDAADRHDATVAAAAESPMRINVLDNIIKLSQSGVNTGPGSEFQNSIKGYLANTPGIGKLFGSTQANVGNFQELQKFMYQNALRNWQAAGGTGTDSQLESAAKANPNDHLFPQALQTIAKWGKASELAVQGKANAQDAFLQQNGNTPTNQIKFESTWRNAFDPKVFQYSLMTPQEKQTFAQQDLKTPQAAKAFIAKQQQLKALGAIQ